MIDDLVRSEINRVSGETQPQTRPIKKVNGFVSNPKKSPMRKFADVFIAEDLGTVKESLVQELIVPTIRNFIVDILVGGVEKLFLGEGRSRGYSERTFTNSLVRSITTTPYNDYSAKSRQPAQSERVLRFSFRDVVMRDRASAQDLLDTLRHAIATYGNVSVAELYDALDCTEEAGADYMDNKWGWTNLDNVPIKRVASGYWLDLPKPVSLK